MIGSAAVAVLSVLTPCSSAQDYPVVSLREEIIQIDVKTAQGRFALETTVYKPEGQGPFPLLIMNHGKDFVEPSQQARARFVALSREFVSRGYAVVIPMRQGFSKSGGSFRHGGCNIVDTGLLQASDIRAVLNVMRTLPWVDAGHIVVGGQSFGGLAVLALGTEALPGVRGLINFAGGVMLKDSACDWKARLEMAVAHYGMKNRLPSLWFYGENDSLFDIRLAERLQKAYTAAGGSAELINVSAFRQDAHRLVTSHHSVDIWWPATERFLRKVDMPTGDSVHLPPVAMPATARSVSGASPEELVRLSDQGRAGYQKFLTQTFPRAFAMSASGAWGWAEDGDDPAETALQQCQKHAKDVCQLYAVNDQVIWQTQKQVAMAGNRN